MNEEKTFSYAYKVVHAKTRYGSNAAIYIRTHGVPGLELLIQKYKLEQYFPKYEKNSIITAVPKSAGIFCFEDIDDAKDFISAYNIIQKSATIVKVKGFNEQFTAKCKSSCGADPTILLLQDHLSYYKTKDELKGDGWRIFSSVKVLD